MSELQSNNWNSIPLALFVGMLLNYTLFPLLPYYIAIVNNYNSKISNLIYYTSVNKYINISTETMLDIKKNSNLNASNIMFVTSYSWEGNMVETNHISTIGNILYTSYSIWLLMASIILLLSMIGTILITLNKNSVK